MEKMSYSQATLRLFGKHGRFAGVKGDQGGGQIFTAQTEKRRARQMVVQPFRLRSTSVRSVQALGWGSEPVGENFGDTASKLKTEEEEMKQSSGMISVLLIKVLVSPARFIVKFSSCDVVFKV